VSIFKNSKLLTLTRYGKTGPGVKESVMTAKFELNGQEFVALNGGPLFKFNESISFVVNCETQEEINYFWKALSADGEENRCGWLKDKFGLSWQIVPTALQEMVDAKDPARSDRVMQALMQMDKLDVAKLKQAYEGTSVT
jgi:predicted 3-demethylubiquinone-9 3-methyltransferase (glyoxalase superfamily)